MNKWLGLGRLTRDPDIRYTNGEEQMCVARYTVAIDRKVKKEGQQNADFVSCVAFGKNGEFAEKYLKKGTKIAVEGRIQTGSYINKDGQKVYTTDIVVESQEFAESKKTSEGQEEPTETNDGYIDIPEGIEQDLPFK